MSGSAQDPVTIFVDEKLDFLMASVVWLMDQMTTMNGRLDAHDRGLMLIEKKIDRASDGLSSPMRASRTKMARCFLTQRGQAMEATMVATVASATTAVVALQMPCPGVMKGRHQSRSILPTPVHGNNRRAMRPKPRRHLACTPRCATLPAARYTHTRLGA
ncbi:hypothetical protein GUJ93_ZPchr0011g27164 [Zizania palustris]|uniref:Uncharacterized protein n=1 Tax=Zizania palustris TaxID=103762 RepID=A0A8J5WH63_ZIZPA|nr:hypothetical protein GUJ93_ZPchr0011g27164 [Zizania palustris]